MIQLIDIQLWDRREQFDKDKEEYQVDIYLLDGEEHHAIGKTPSEALLMAAAHWHAYSRPKTNETL